jgi:hypothetical protein
MHFEARLNIKYCCTEDSMTVVLSSSELFIANSSKRRIPSPLEKVLPVRKNLSFLTNDRYAFLTFFTRTHANIFIYTLSITTTPVTHSRGIPTLIEALESVPNECTNKV